MSGREVPQPDPQQLLAAVTTEHFTLQGARAQTASESAPEPIFPSPKNPSEKSFATQDKEN